MFQSPRQPSPGRAAVTVLPAGPCWRQPERLGKSSLHLKKIGLKRGLSVTKKSWIMEGFVQYLAQNFPDALSYAQRSGFTTSQISDLTAVLNIILENGLQISSSEVCIQNQIDSGSFGSIFKAIYRGQAVVLKRIDQVKCFKQRFSWLCYLCAMLTKHFLSKVQNNFV